MMEYKFNILFLEKKKFSALLIEPDLKLYNFEKNANYNL